MYITMNCITGMFTKLPPMDGKNAMQNLHLGTSHYLYTYMYIYKHSC